jgi:hypothetical protein
MHTDQVLVDRTNEVDFKLVILNEIVLKMPKFPSEQREPLQGDMLQASDDSRHVRSSVVENYRIKYSRLPSI